jgi:hypothetical protein
VSDEPSDVTAPKLVDAFIHPPDVADVGFRAESTAGEVLIVSLVEVWPWRTVIRGLRADKSASVSSLGARPQPDSDAPSGVVVGAARLMPDQEMLERQRAVAAWYTAWRVADDVETEYRSVGAGGGGSGGALWSDFRIEFQPGVPQTARHLAIISPDGHEISLHLDA